MNGSSKSVLAAIEWLKSEIARSAFGRISIGVQVHEGRVAKVFKSVEEITLASPDPSLPDRDERG